MRNDGDGPLQPMRSPLLSGVAPVELNLHLAECAGLGLQSYPSCALSPCGGAQRLSLVQNLRYLG